MTAGGLDGRRLEELGLNSSAPPGQLLYDGWLVRMAPGKAKRARSVNAVYPSRLGIDEKVAYCERLYAQAKLPALFRITPFSEPAGLDDALAQRGYMRFDTTAVESLELLGREFREDPRVVEMGLPEWVVAVAQLRTSPASHLQAHLARLQGMSLRMRPLALLENEQVKATGLLMAEDDAVGIFDVVTREDARRRGYGRTLVEAMLASAKALGLRHCYLQVSADNVAARSMYRAFGFVERYEYWYRARPGEAA